MNLAELYDAGYHAVDIWPEEQLLGQSGPADRATESELQRAAARGLWRHMSATDGALG